MASPRHDRSSVTNPSRASSYSSPTTARRAVRGTAHRVPSCIGDVTKSSRSPRAGGKAPPRVTSVRGALYVGRGDRKKTGLCGGMPCATNSSTKTLPDPKGDAEGPSSSARLIWGCWCHLRRSFSKVSQLSIYPLLSAFLAFFCRAPRGGARGCRRSLAERSLKCPSYTNFTDRRWGAGLLIQTNRMSLLPTKSCHNCKLLAYWPVCEPCAASRS